jgi:hypothetical protein
MKVLKSPLAQAIQRDPVAGRAMMDALIAGGTFQFDGKAYRPIITPKAPDEGAPSLMDIGRRVIRDYRHILLALKDKQ